MQPIFLSLSDVLGLHQNQLRLYGGTNGIRDLNLLQSAINTPQVTYDGQFLHTSIYEMATAYLFHIIKNHPFIDGNKRTGLIVALTFLSLNGYDFDAPKEKLLKTILLVASGKLSKSEVAIFIQKWARAG